MKLRANVILLTCLAFCALGLFKCSMGEAQQLPIYCQNPGAVQCTTGGPPPQTGTGDQGWLFGGKINTMMGQLYGTSGVASLYPTLTLNMTGVYSLSTAGMYSPGTTITGAPTTYTDGQVAPFRLLISSDTADATTHGPGWLDTIAVIDQPQAGHLGGRTAVFCKENIVGSPSAAGTIGYVGCQGIVSMSANLGGTDLASYADSAGGGFGMNCNVFTVSGATFLRNATCIEADSTLVSGSSSAEHHGFTCVEGSAQAVRGTYDDSCFMVANQSSASSGHNWQTVFEIGSNNHPWALDTDSCVICVNTPSFGNATMKYMINATNATGTGSGDFLASPGFTVDWSGNVTPNALLGAPLQINVNSSTNATNIGTGSTSGTVTAGGGSNAVTLNATTLTEIGAPITLNASHAGNINVGTGTASGIITIGNASNLGNTVVAGLTTGTPADAICLAAGNVLMLDAANCISSSWRFKNHILHWTGDPLAELDRLEVDSFQLNDNGNRDPNAKLTQIGLIAENVAKVEPKCAVWENDLKTPKSYRPECVTALLVSASQEFHRESRHQFAMIYALLAVLAALALHSGHLHLKVRRLTRA